MEEKKKENTGKLQSQRHFHHDVASPTNAVNEIDTSRQRKTLD